MSQSFDLKAYVSAAGFIADRAVFALGDGRVVFEGGVEHPAHAGAVLCAALDPGGRALLTGGDDGRLVRTTPEGGEVVADLGSAWIDAIAASPASGLIAFAAGRDVHVRDVRDPAFARTFGHERSVAGLAFEPKGRRLACATYGGAALWFARIAEQKPVLLRWAGSHIAALFSPAGRFLVSAMQENAPHGWRLSDGKDMRMGGYPAKPKSLVFLSKGALMATSGAHGAVLWPFTGAQGPMGREANQLGYDESTRTTVVAAAPGATRLSAGLEDGRVWTADVTASDLRHLKAEKGAPISALAVSADGRRLAWGDEDGGAGVVALG